VPLGLSSEQAANRGGHYLVVVARMADTATVSAVQTEMDGIAARMEETYPQTNKGWGVVVSSLNEEIVGEIRRPLLVLVCAVAFVLLIACANVASLLLARGSARATEIAIRSALGASRLRLVRQLLTESLCLSLVGAVLGVVLASWGIDALLSLAPTNIPRLSGVRIDGSALAFTLVISVLTVIIFGLAPALQLSKVAPGETLKEGGRGQSGSSAGRLARKVLVVAEVALSLVLLIGAGLLIQSFIRLRAVEPGFQSDRILTGTISLPDVRYSEPHMLVDFFRELVSRASSVPGAETAAVANPLPFMGDALYGFLVEGRDSENVPSANYYAVSDTYFDALRIPLVKGRFFKESDSMERPRVAIINETMANRYFPGEEPIGKRMHITNGPTAFREIVGVVGDVKQYGLNTTSPAQMYEPYLQNPQYSMHLIVRAAGEPSGLYSAVRDQVRSLDAEQPISNLQTLDHILALSIAPERFSMLLLTIFAGLAFILAAVGIYGLMSYQVGRRTREIGLRVALGASGADVLKLVVGQGMQLALIGVALGVIGALALTHLMSRLLFEVNPQDPLVFAIVSMLFTGIALLACYIPAQRATRVDPMEALRYE
jgi:putative ABC transport system permease protein